MNRQCTALGVGIGTGDRLSASNCNGNRIAADIDVCSTSAIYTLKVPAGRRLFCNRVCTGPYVIERFCIT